jgi:YVTN family beta-propeller protein
MKKISVEVMSRFLGSRLVRPMLAAGVLAAGVLPAGQMSGQVIPTPGLKPEGLVVAPIGTQNLYVAANKGAGNASHFVVINTQFNSITADLPLVNLNTSTVEHGATVITMNPKGTLVFVVNSTSQTVDVINVATNTEIATFQFPLIGPTPAGVAVSPNGEQLWVPNLGTFPFNNGTVNIVGVDSSNFGQAIGLVNTGSSPNQVVFNSKGSVAYVQNGSTPTNTGFIDEVNAKVFPFKILRNNIGNTHLNSPNPVSMAITKDNSTLYVGNAESYVNNLDIPTGTFDNTIFMFPGISPALQQIGQVLISPNQKFVVSADTTLGSVSVANTATQTQSEFLVLPAGAVPYFMAFSPDGRTLYVSNFNGAIPPVGGLDSITSIPF